MIQKSDEQAWVDTQALAQRYAVATRTIGEWRKHHGLPFVKLAAGRKTGAVRFHVETVDQWMLDRMQSSAQK